MFKVYNKTKTRKRERSYKLLPLFCQPEIIHIWARKMTFARVWGGGDLWGQMAKERGGGGQGVQLHNIVE